MRRLSPLPPPPSTPQEPFAPQRGWPPSPAPPRNGAPSPPPSKRSTRNPSLPGDVLRHGRPSPPFSSSIETSAPNVLAKRAAARLSETSSCTFGKEGVLISSSP